MNLKIRPLCFHHPLTVDTIFDDVDLFLNQWTVKGYLGPSKIAKLYVSTLKLCVYLEVYDIDRYVV